MLGPVTRQERDTAPAYLTDVHVRRRLAVGRVDLDLRDPVNEGVETGAAEDADLRGVQADFSFAAGLGLSFGFGFSLSASFFGVSVFAGSGGALPLRLSVA